MPAKIKSLTDRAKLRGHACADRMSAVSILLNLTKSLSNGVWRRRSTCGTYLPFFNDGLAIRATIRHS
jgi:hypothetical protein